MHQAGALIKQQSLDLLMELINALKLVYIKDICVRTLLPQVSQVSEFVKSRCTIGPRVKRVDENMLYWRQIVHFQST
jgi:hypothetical protein